MKTLTIKVDGNTYKQFHRMGNIDWAVHHNDHVQIANHEDEQVLLLNEKPDQCHDLYGGASKEGLIWVYYEPYKARPTA